MGRGLTANLPIAYHTLTPMLKQPPVRWAPRVRPGKVRRLYERDALGILDADLIDDVGFALYSRCRSIVQVSEAMHGRVTCPECEAVFLQEGGALLLCPACGWQAAWDAYHKTFRHQELYGGGAVDLFARFIADWEAAVELRHKMRLIDRLIHAWHWETRDDHVLGRPTGVNLIEGSRAQVLALLDSLTYGAGSTPGAADTATRWREHWARVRGERDR